jgi:antitoxin VapB
MRRARVFKSGNSQAVRLPREFQVDTNEVMITKKNSELILSPIKKTWADYFEHGRRFSEDFPETIEDVAAEERPTW